MGELRHLLEARFRRWLKAGPVGFVVEMAGRHVTLSISTTAKPCQRIIITPQGFQADYSFKGEQKRLYFRWDEVLAAAPGKTPPTAPGGGHSLRSAA